MSPEECAGFPADFNILKCMQCGLCSGSCPSGRHTALNIRRFVRRVSLGLPAEEDESLWACTTCYNCQERCPRSVRIVDMVLRIRQDAVHRGIILEPHRKVTALLVETGHAVPINTENEEKRKQLGLPIHPPTVHTSLQGLEEVRKLLKSCGFERIAGEGP